MEKQEMKATELVDQPVIEKAYRVGNVTFYKAPGPQAPKNVEIVDVPDHEHFMKMWQTMDIIFVHPVLQKLHSMDERFSNL